ncbi:hypothetical protein M0R45_031463 [Rubus argutus]|uniref:Uncharacterized protein n=1 Tax=Rubus argutus TaxID=59490 RepID=A0AAW1WFY1_RUBAR
MEKAEKESEKIERPKTQPQDAVPSYRHNQADTKPRSRLRSSRPVPPLNVVVDPRRAQPQFDPNRAAAKTTTGWQPEKKNKEDRRRSTAER